MDSQQATAWRIICELTSPGRLSFDTARRIRSAEFHGWEIYAMYRLSNHVEQPTRTQAKKLLAQAMTFRNLTIPKNNKPLTVPILAHETVSVNTMKFLRKHIVLFKHLAIPLHLPTAKPLRDHWPACSIINHRLWEKNWNVCDISCLSCCCVQLKQLLRHDCIGMMPLSVPVSLRRGIWRWRWKIFNFLQPSPFLKERTPRLQYF